LLKTNGAIALLQDEEHTGTWRGILVQLADQNGLHGLLAGRCCRLLLDAGVFTGGGAARRLSLAVSTANEPAHAAAWVDGFLKGSGLLLLHDQSLWQVIDNWVVALNSESFASLLPLLRRTFSTFPAPERKQMGERVRSKSSQEGRLAIGQNIKTDFDHQRAAAVLPLVAQLLGLETE